MYGGSIKINVHYRMSNVFTCEVGNQKSLETLGPENSK